MTKAEYYLDIALTVAKKSTCLKKHYGAVIVNNDEIISTGFNGPARNEPHCATCTKKQGNGDMDVEASDIVATTTSLVGAVIGSTFFPGTTVHAAAVIASVNGLADIVEKSILDNEGVKHTGYNTLFEFFRCRWFLSDGLRVRRNEQTLMPMSVYIG